MAVQLSIPPDPDAYDCRGGALGCAVMVLATAVVLIGFGMLCMAIVKVPA